jgi:hypothetical protein
MAVHTVLSVWLRDLKSAGHVLDQACLTVPPEEAASSHVAEIVAGKVGVEEMQPVGLIICGSVAVNRRRRRPPG